MSPLAILALIAQKNGLDIEAIIEKVGLPTLIALLPHIIAIYATVEAQKEPSA
jgi:hypothetical protein